MPNNVTVGIELFDNAEENTQTVNMLAQVMAMQSDKLEDQEINAIANWFYLTYNKDETV